MTSFMRVFHSHALESFESRLSRSKIDHTGEWVNRVFCPFFRRGVLVRSILGVSFDSLALVEFSERTQNLLLYSRECFGRSRVIKWLRRGQLRRFWFAETSILTTRGRFCRRFPLGVSSRFRSLVQLGRQVSVGGLCVFVRLPIRRSVVMSWGSVYLEFRIHALFFN